MSKQTSSILEVAQAGFLAQEAELARDEERKTLAVFTQNKDGSADLSELFGLDKKFRLIFVRCHFSGVPGTATLYLKLDSRLGSRYDLALATLSSAGPGSDVNFPLNFYKSPSEALLWAFQEGDRILVEWSNPNPGVTQWGLEVGMALVD
jgi:hypothetical protein